MEILDITGLGRGWEEITLCPLGDIQAGIEACDIDLLQRDIDKALRHDAYFIGMGDFLDVASPSNRSRYAGANLYDSFHEFMEVHMLEEEAKLLKILEPTKNRWLGMLHGHHLWEYRDGTTTDTHFADAMGCAYLGTSAMIRVWFKDGKNEVPCTIHASHGHGSGDPLVKLRKTASWADADLLLMGHYHKRKAEGMPRMSLMGPPGKPQLVDTERTLVATGSYLKGYLQGSKAGLLPKGGYVETALMEPVSLGCPLVHIQPETRNNITRLDIRVVT